MHPVHPSTWLVFYVEFWVFPVEDILYAHIDTHKTYLVSGTYKILPELRDRSENKTQLPEKRKYPFADDIVKGIIDRWM